MRMYIHSFRREFFTEVADWGLVAFSSAARNFVVGDSAHRVCFTARQSHQFCTSLLRSGCPVLLKNVDSSMFRCQLWYRLDTSAGCKNDVRLLFAPHAAACYAWWQDFFFFSCSWWWCASNGDRNDVNATSASLCLPWEPCSYKSSGLVPCAWSSP